MKLYWLSKQHLAGTTAGIVVGIFVCVWSITAFAEGAADATDWPQWRGPNRDGISSEKGWLSTWPEGGPKQLWRLSVGTGYSSVAVSNGRVYTMGNVEKTDTVYCLDADTGAEMWTHSYPCATESGGHPGPASTPTVDGGYVYTLSREGDLFCLDAGSGNVIWSRNVKDFGAKSPEWDFASSVLVLDNMVIVDAGMALALDKSTGNLIWKTKDYGDVWDDIKNQGGGYSAPFAFNLNDRQRLAVFNASGLVILDPKNGQELMLHPWKTSYNIHAAIPIVSGDKVFISSGYNVGCALIQVSGAKPTVMWQNRNMRNHFNSCVLWQGHLYGFDESQLRCLDWDTGDVKWTQRGLGKGSLMLADGRLIIMSDKGKLVIAEASPEGFNELAGAKLLSGLCWTVPVLSNGRIYCRNHEGDLVCVDVKG
jgi:outer membrane protein assembly factor BamB